METTVHTIRTKTDAAKRRAPKLCGGRYTLYCYRPKSIKSVSPRKFTASPQHKRQVRNKLAASPSTSSENNYFLLKSVTL